MRGRDGEQRHHGIPDAARFGWPAGVERDAGLRVAPLARASLQNGPRWATSRTNGRSLAATPPPLPRTQALGDAEPTVAKL